MAEITVREVAWSTDRDAIMALRVRVLANRNRGDFTAEQPVTDPLDIDRSTWHFMATNGDGRAIAAVRLSRSEPRAWFLSHEIDGLGVTSVSRLEVSPDVPRGVLMMQLLEAAYKRARAVGSMAWIAVVPVSQAEIWRELGFVPARVKVSAAWEPLLLDLGDVAHLRAVRSPLASVAQRYLNTEEHHDRIAALRAQPEAPCPDAERPRTEQPVYVLSDEALEEPRLLEDVDRPLLKAILGRRLVERFDPGETIPLREGGLFEVLGGELTVEADEPLPLLRLRRREVLGVDDLDGKSPGDVTLRVIRPAQILRVSAEELEVVGREAPALALKLYKNACTGLRRSLRRATARLQALNTERMNEPLSPGAKLRHRASVARILARTA